MVLNPYLRAIRLATPAGYDIDYANSFKPVLVNQETGERTEIPLMDPMPDDYFVIAAIAPNDADQKAFYDRYKLGKAVKDAFKRFHDLLAAERREVERLNAVIERLSRTLGEKSDDEKGKNVGDCLKHFEKTFRVQEGVSEAQRDDVLRRVKAVLKALSHEKLYATVTENDLVVAVTASGPKSARERSKRIQYIKRFCMWLCRSVERGGLGFIGNPASELKAEGEQAIQARRRATGAVSTLDPQPLLLTRLPLYWRAFIGVMGFAGLRRGEAEGLTWDAIDFENRIIHVRANKYYQQLKTDLSERPVPPFQELWTILEEYRKFATHAELVFPRLNWERWTNPSWLTMYKGRINAYDLSDELADALTTAGIDEKEPSRRLRRYWETRMRSEGYSQFVAQHAGHSDGVGRSHYSDWQAIARDLSAKMRVKVEEKKKSEAAKEKAAEKCASTKTKRKVVVISKPGVSSLGRKHECL